MSQDDFEIQNRRTLRKLILTVEANSQGLELLIAICDDRNLQASVIEAYEAELQVRGIRTFQARLNPESPSIKASLTALVDREPTLQRGEPAVVTVLNAEALSGNMLKEEKSQQEQFFFSLQWTREALRRFKFAVVLWVPDAIATKLGQRAPDFWSWRGGVFEFLVNESTPSEEWSSPSMVGEETTGTRESLKIGVLQQRVEALEEAAPDSSLLITLYNSLGEAYEREADRSKARVQYEKALGLAERKKNLSGQAKTLRNIGNSLRNLGRPLDSIFYYERSLEISKEIGDRQGTANSLSNLGLAYQSIGQHQQAIAFQQQWLELARELGNRQGESDALRNIGIAYEDLGQPQQAAELRQQWLEAATDIRRKINNSRSREDSSYRYSAGDELVDAKQARENSEAQPYITNNAVQNRDAVMHYLSVVTARLGLIGGIENSQEFWFEGATLNRIVRIPDFEMGIGMRGEALFIFSEFAELNIQILQQFSTQSLTWAKQGFNPESAGRAFYNFRIPTYLCFAIAIVERLDEVTRTAIKTTNPIAHRVDLLWYEVPVVYELATGELQYYRQAANFLENFRGEIAWKQLRNIIQKLLSPAPDEA